MLVLEGVTKTFNARRNGHFTGVLDGVDLFVRNGETFGLSGQSGSGKTTLARIIPGLIRPCSGRILFNGEDITSLNGKKKVAIRKKIQIIFQTPRLSLDPKQTVFDAVAEPMRVHGIAGSKPELRDNVMSLLSDCGLPAEIAKRRPGEISGGQAQRVVLARALGIDPELIIGDEMTSMLDVSVQAQILELLQKIQEKRGLTVILISHDMDILNAVCDRAAVLKDGKLHGYQYF